MRLRYAEGIEFEKREERFGVVVVLMAAEIEALREKVGEKEVSLEEMRKSVIDGVRRV